MTGRGRVLLLIPAFNEEASIGHVVVEARQVSFGVAEVRPSCWYGW